MEIVKENKIKDIAPEDLIISEKMSSSEGFDYYLIKNPYKEDGSWDGRINDVKQALRDGLCHNFKITQHTDNPVPSIEVYLIASSDTSIIKRIIRDSHYYFHNIQIGFIIGFKTNQYDPNSDMLFVDESECLRKYDYSITNTRFKVFETEEAALNFIKSKYEFASRVSEEYQSILSLLESRIKTVSMSQLDFIMSVHKIMNINNIDCEDNLFVLHVQNSIRNLSNNDLIYGNSNISRGLPD